MLIISFTKVSLTTTDFVGYIRDYNPQLQYAARSADGLLFDEKIPVQMPATGDRHRDDARYGSLTVIQLWQISPEKFAPRVRSCANSLHNLFDCAVSL